MPIKTGTAKRDIIHGDFTNDLILGLAGDDMLFGGAGRDTLKGGDGNDHLFGQEDRDKLYGEAGDDTIDGGTSSDTIDGGLGNDIIRGGMDDDSIKGGAGDDKIFGGEGIDRLDGGFGADTLRGGAGGDNYYTDVSGDVVKEAVGGGNDAIYTTASQYTLLPGSEIEYMAFIGKGNFTATGNEFDNTIGGSDSGQNIISGMGGDDFIGGGNFLNPTFSDIISGGDGQDRMIGAGGIDYFMYATPNASETGDTITDFVSGTDHINVQASGFGGGLTGSGIQLGIAINASQLVIGTTPDQAFGQFLFHDNQLFWDDDGTGADAAVQICTLTGVTTLVAADITVS